MASVPKKTYTLAEYFALDEKTEIRHEYYRGEIFAMTGGTPNHARIVRNLAVQIQPHLRQDAGCEVFFTDLRLLIQSADLYTYPDLAVACGGKFEGIALTNPKVLCEVLSPSTERYDRGKKFDFYRQIPSLEEYVLVSQQEPLVECFSRMPGGKWELTVFKGIDAEVIWTSIGWRAPMMAIYEDVDFQMPPDAPELRIHPGE